MEIEQDVEIRESYAQRQIYPDPFQLPDFSFELIIISCSFMFVWMRIPDYTTPTSADFVIQ